LLNPALRRDFDVRSAGEFNGFQPNSLRNGTGNFQTRIREFFSRNREFPPANREPVSHVIRGPKSLEGEELGSNILRVSQRSPANSSVGRSKRNCFQLSPAQTCEPLRFFMPMLPLIVRHRPLRLLLRPARLMHRCRPSSFRKLNSGTFPTSDLADGDSGKGMPFRFLDVDAK
jgi:hypothetical protein